MSALTIKSPADIPDAAASLLGFRPTESLVIVPLGPNAPTARVDLPEEGETFAPVLEALAPAVPHWSDKVLVVVFSERDVLTEAALALGIDLGLDIVFSVRTHGDTVWTVDGQAHRTRPDAVNNCDDTTPVAGIAESREALAEAAAQVADPAEALALAWASYESGNGAHAWVYIDRFLALDGDHNDVLDLANRLSTAVNPHTNGA